MDALNLLLIFLILATLQPALQRQLLAAKRRRVLGRMSAKRNATVITLIHRQETISFLGLPLMRHIDIDDAESILRAIRETPAGRPIEIILHTPGGLVLAASQIAIALADHDGPVTAVVPHYAMSGGTMIALAADEIVLERHAALGPIDPQLGQYPAASIVAALEAPGMHRDEFLILGDMSRKALRQVESFARRLLEQRMSPERAKDVARLLSTGVWTHDHPLMPADLEPLGLPIKIGVPPEERELAAGSPESSISPELPSGRGYLRDGSARGRSASLPVPAARNSEAAGRPRRFDAPVPQECLPSVPGNVRSPSPTSATRRSNLNPETPSGAAARPRSGVSVESRSRFEMAPAAPGPASSLSIGPRRIGAASMDGLCARSGRLIHPPLWVDWPA